MYENARGLYMSGQHKALKYVREFLIAFWRSKLIFQALSYHNYFYFCCCLVRFVFKTGAQGLGYYRDDQAPTKAAAPTTKAAAPTTKAAAEISSPTLTQQAAVVAPTAAAGPFDYQKLEVPLTRAVMTNAALFELD